MKELLKLINKKGYYQILSGGNNVMSIEVKIVDIKKCYGNIRYEITPISGNGTIWVNCETVRNLHD